MDKIELIFLEHIELLENQIIKVSQETQKLNYYKKIINDCKFFLSEEKIKEIEQLYLKNQAEKVEAEYNEFNKE